MELKISEKFKKLIADTGLEFCIIDRELHTIIVNSLLGGSINKMYSQIYPLISISQQLDPLYERSMSGKEGDGKNLIVTLYPVIK